MTASSPPSNTGALVLFSGGQDSSACLAWALDRYERVETVGFDYGQRHLVELDARPRILAQIPGLDEDWAARLGEDHVLDIRAFGAIGQTAMTTDRVIEMDERGLPTTFVPGRNLVFLLYAAALADRRGLEVLVGGMCETDYSGYPDCRRDTLDAFEGAINLGMDRRFRIETPLMFLTKAQTWALAQDLGGDALTRLIIQDSHTCYLGERGDLHDWGYGCGTCPSCALRARGFAEWSAAGRPGLGR
jgi:7-cyano-7-deazaguanine synthase